MVGKYFLTGISIFVILSATKLYAHNLQPDADISSPSGPCYIDPADPTGRTVDFDGSGSSDPDGSIVKYEWNWGDGTGWHESGEQAAHSFYTAGEYTVSLRVTDNDGASDTTDTSEDVTVYAMKVEVTQPSGMNAWVHTNHNIALDCELTPSSAGGGSYHWYCTKSDTSFIPNASIKNPSLCSTEPNTIRVWVEYTNGGVTVNSGWADALIRAVEVELYRDSQENGSFDYPLDDWDDGGCPKYIFGKDDPIYVFVPYYAGLSDVVEEFPSAVMVKSESDTSGDIKLLIAESYGGEQDCTNENSINQHELLYLATSSSQGNDGDYIKVEEEELLTFYLKVPPDGGYVESNSVKVDKGEFFEVAGSDDGKNNEDFNYAISEAEDKIDAYYKWSKNGYMEGRAYASACVMSTDDKAYENSKEVKINDSSSDSNSSDLIIYSGHGKLGDLETCHVPNTDTCGSQFYAYWSHMPAVVGAGWSDDVDWILFSACQVFGKQSDPDEFVNHYINYSFDNNKIHGILGSCQDIRIIAMNDDPYQFIEQLRYSNVVQSYKAVCYRGWNTEYGILVREENKDDVISADIGSITAGRLGRDISGKAGKYYYYYYNGNQKTFDIAGNGSPISSDTVNYHKMKKAIRNSIEIKGQIQIPKLEVKSEPNAIQNVFSVNGHTFDSIETMDFSFKAYTEDAYEDGKHNIEIQDEGEREYLNSLGLGLSEDYELENKGKMEVNTYIVADENSQPEPSENWCEAEDFIFVRRYDGHKIFSDRCKIMVRNNRILRFSLTYHTLQKDGMISVPRADFYYKGTELESNLLYKFQKNKLVPYWEVIYGRYAFHYEAAEIK